MGTPIAKPSPPPKYWPLAQHVLCFECKGYNYQGAVSYKTEYWSDGYEVFHSADTVVASNMEELCESYPSGGGWRMGGGYTPGFAQIARNLRVRRALLDTLYCLCFQPRIETLLDEAVMAGLAMIGMVEATVTRDDKTTTIRRFYLSSTAMGAVTIAAAVRAHWRIG